MVECQLPKLDVAGSIPVSRSIFISYLQARIPPKVRAKPTVIAYVAGKKNIESSVNETEGARGAAFESLRGGLKPQSPATHYQSSYASIRAG